MKKTVNTIEEFQNFLANAVKTGLGDSVKDVITNVTLKNNGIKLHSVTVFTNSSDIGPAFYVDDLFEAYKKDEPLSKLTDEFVNFVDSYLKDMNNNFITFDYNKLFEFDNVKDSIVMTLINTEANKEKLDNYPHREWNDLSIVYRAIVLQTDGGVGSVLITNELLSEWNVSENDLYEHSKNNMLNLNPACIAFEDIINEILDEKDKDLQIKLNEVPMYVITNDKKLYGASSIFYPGALKSVSEVFGTNLFLLPSSVHEFIAVSSDGVNKEDMERLFEIVSDVNTNVIEPELFLSNNIYYYDKETDSIEMFTK